MDGFCSSRGWNSLSNSWKAAIVYKPLLPSGANYDPVWNVDGLRYGFRSNGTGTNLYYLFHEDGTPIDTLINSGSGKSWNHPTYSPGAYSAQLVLGDQRDSSIILETVSWTMAIRRWSAFVIAPATSAIYSSRIYAMDIQTRKRPSCGKPAIPC